MFQRQAFIKVSATPYATSLIATIVVHVMIQKYPLQFLVLFEGVRTHINSNSEVSRMQYIYTYFFKIIVVIEKSEN